MRRLPSHANPNWARIAIALLIALGLALTDATIVFGRAPSGGRSTTLTPDIDLALDVAPDRESSARARVLRATPGAESAHVGPGCAEDGCQPAAAPSLAARPPAVVARWSSLAEPGAARPNVSPARIVPLSLLSPAPALTANCQLLLDLPWRPARETGADRSVPRPPSRL
jgi:hypothetical protein